MVAGAAVDAEAVVVAAAADGKRVVRAASRISAAPLSSRREDLSQETRIDFLDYL